MDRSSPIGFRHLVHDYGPSRALDDATACLEIGTTVLLGDRGAGKSTLCRVLVGRERANEGDVLRGGRPLSTPLAWRRHEAVTGWLPQTVAVPSSSLTVLQYLRYGAWLKGVGARKAPALVKEALERTGLVDRRRQRLGQLTGGELRRVGIAHAITHRPTFLVLDEPGVDLDAEDRRWLAETIAELARERIVLVAAERFEDVVEIGEIAERLLVLESGRVVHDERAVTV